MHRWLGPFRRASFGKLKELDTLTTWRHPILLACLSSGLIYHGYSLLPQCNKIDYKESLHRKMEDIVLLFGDQNSGDNSSNEIRMDRLLKLHRDIEDILPQFFITSISNVSGKLMDLNTVVCFEQSNGVQHILRNKSVINLALMAARTFYTARSYSRRLELSSVLTDTEKWEIEVCFRIVLLRSPTHDEYKLSSKQLKERLEQNAQWRDFRAIFHLSDSGQISSIIITQFIPPPKSAETLQALKNLPLWKKLNPTLPSGTRRLPTPTPFAFDKHYVNLNSTIDCQLLYNYLSNQQYPVNVQQMMIKQACSPPSNQRPHTILNCLSPHKADISVNRTCSSTSDTQIDCEVTNSLLNNTYLSIQQQKSWTQSSISTICSMANLKNLHSVHSPIVFIPKMLSEIPNNCVIRTQSNLFC